jgi:hypothetical protein
MGGHFITQVIPEASLALTQKGDHCVELLLEAFEVGSSSLFFSTFALSIRRLS